MVGFYYSSGVITEISVGGADLFLFPEHNEQLLPGDVSAPEAAAAAAAATAAFGRSLPALAPRCCLRHAAPPHVVLPPWPRRPPRRPLPPRPPRRLPPLVRPHGRPLLLLLLLPPRRLPRIPLPVERLHFGSGRGLRRPERHRRRLRRQPALPTLLEQLAHQRRPAETPGPGDRHRRGLRHAVRGQPEVAWTRRPCPARSRLPDRP